MQEVNNHCCGDELCDFFRLEEQLKRLQVGSTLRIRKYRQKTAAEIESDPKAESKLIGENFLITRED